MNAESPDDPPEHICSVCQASFTRKTHLTRHLRSHMNQRTYACTLCGRATFTRSDLLNRHAKRCSLNPGGVPPSRKKACLSCIQRKVKCDLQKPCAKCVARGTNCTYARSRSPESNPEPLPSLPLDAAGFSKPQESDVDRLLDSRDSREVSALVRATELPLEPWETRPPSFIDNSIDSAFPFLGLFDLNQEVQPVSVPPLHPNLFNCPSKISECSALSLAGPSMNSETLLNPPSFNGFPCSNPNANPHETVLEINASFFDDFLNQAPTSTFQNFDPLFTPFSIPPAFGSPDTMVETPSPDVDNYLTRFFSFHCRQFPFVHLPTWSESTAPPLLVRAMQASGALYATGTAQGKAADRHIIDTLQSNLRQEIFRSFIDTPAGDLDTQAGLILSLASIQNLGLFHRSQVERSASTAYHGMMVTMIRKSGIPAALEAWDLRKIETLDSPQAWASWVRYETMKRILLLVYLHDTLMPVFHNLPSSLGENEFSFRLPCDDALWEAPTAECWAALAAPNPTALRGAPLHVQLSALLNPRLDAPPAPLNRFACFVTIHALLRAAALERGAHIPLQRALGQWYVCWLAGGGGGAGTGAGEPNFTSSVLPLYWLAQLLAQVDGGNPVSHAGNVRYRTVKRWLKDFWVVLRASGEIGLQGSATGTAFVEDVAPPPKQQADRDDDDDDGLLEWVPR